MASVYPEDAWEASSVTLARKERVASARKLPTLGLSSLLMSCLLTIAVGMVVWGIMDAFSTQAYQDIAVSLDRALVRDVKAAIQLFGDAAVSVTGTLRDSYARLLRYGDTSDQAVSDELVPLVRSSTVTALYVGLPNGRINGFEAGDPLIQVLTNESSGFTTISLATLLGEPYQPLFTLTDYNATERAWYGQIHDEEDLIAQRQGKWTDIYVNAGSPYVSLTFSNGVVNREAPTVLEAVCGCDVSTETVSIFLASKQVGTSGRGALWLYNAAGYFVATGNATILEEIVPSALFPMSSFNNEVVNRTMEVILRAAGGDYGATPALALQPEDLVIGGVTQQWLITNEPLAEGLANNLTLVIAVPASDFFTDAQNARILGLAVSLGVLVPVFASLMAIITYVFFALPLKKSERHLDHLTRELDFAEPAERRKKCGCCIYSTIWEIGSIQRSEDRLHVALASFSKYVPVDLLRRLLRAGRAATLGVSSTKATALFGDISDLEAVLQGINDPSTSAALLREYFEVMATGIDTHNGTLVDFIGSLVFGIWYKSNDADEQDEAGNARRACEAALRQQEGLQLLRERLVKNSRSAPWKQFRCTIGIATGNDALVGNIGSTSRFKFTMVGDTVNTASRLQHLNRVYGTLILISEATKEEVSAHFVTRVLDVVAVKGKTEGGVIFELLGRRASATEAMLAVERLSQEWLNFYLEREWSSCMRVLRELQTLLGKNQGLDLLMERTKEFAAQGVPEGWTGMLHMEVK